MDFLEEIRHFYEKNHPTLQPQLFKNHCSKLTLKVAFPGQINIFFIVSNSGMRNCENTENPQGAGMKSLLGVRGRFPLKLKKFCKSDKKI